ALPGERARPVGLGRYGGERLVVAVGRLGVGAGLVGLAPRLAAPGARVGERLFGWQVAIPVNLRSLTPSLALLVLVFAATMFVNQKQGDVHGSDSGYAFWRDREAIAARLEALGAGGVVELDDGILSYSLPSGAMNGFGFALDREAFEAWNRAELLD